MINFLKEIEIKINKKLKPEKVLIIDNSNLHTKHKSFDPKKYHIKIEIKSEKLRNMQKIEAHKVIFSILKDEMRRRIHALEIKIE
tara:strand:+ start:159 stop:413 length:255 start_codon:yes stop_codon:yes gene_type:complete